MKIGIIGSGIVGQTLGTALAAQGNSVKIGSREPQSEKLQEWLGQAGENASTGTFAEAAQFGDLIILATLWSGTEDAIKLAGPENLAGKTLLDATNPLKFDQNGPGNATDGNDSAGENVQRWAPEAKVVKAFNTAPSAIMIKPDLLGDTPDMFICGNDEGAKAEATVLVKTFGWPVIDLGGIEESRLIEALGMIWVKYYVKTQNWQHVFKLIRKEA